MTDKTLLPRARQEEIFTVAFGDELLVYDKKRYRAHCLNRTAALIWRHCDGAKTVEEIIDAVARETGGPVDEELVLLGLDRLMTARLLEKREERPYLSSTLPRREMLRRLRIAGIIAVPVVTSILAPTALAAGSCLASGTICTLGSDCCSGLCDTTQNPARCV